MSDTPTAKLSLLASARRIVSNGWFIGIASNLLTGAIVYFFTVEHPDITYLVSASRTSIVSASQTSQLSVTYGSRPIKGDLSSVQIAIWNSGRKAVLRTDVLEPLIITLKDAHIIDEKILTKTRPVTEIALATNPTIPDSVLMTWRILEHNDGAKIQLIYEGDLTVPVDIKGAVVGQAKINGTQSTISSDSGSRTPSIVGLLFVAIFAMAGSVVFWRWVVEWFRMLPKKGARNWKFLLVWFVVTSCLFVFGATLVGLGLRALYLALFTQPPFAL